MNQDGLWCGLLKESKLRVAFVHASETASTLERRHLSGPTAGMALGQAVAGACLLSADCTRPDERVTLQLRVDGPLGGTLVEVCTSGRVRGYTHSKVLNDYDGLDQIALEPALGTRGSVHIMFSLPKGVISQATLETAPPSFSDALDQYYNHSMQTPTSVVVAARSANGYLASAAGVYVQCMPDSDSKAFVRIQKAFASGAAATALHLASEPEALALTLGWSDVEWEPARKIHFGCSCSQERAEALLNSLSYDDLTDILNGDREQRIFCHMCGEGYDMPMKAVNRALDGKA